ncbi:hypothetical protein CCACVL1_00369 [Corchorus capsularis]|uniref:Uncharacterized protein n=1 Tax=Corchorus capsularis TaxID=210143 RepID=A0A1R3IS01_COCAP|nr:hypothetical protein CCACVL1_10251 [Corchorus capsularis]OMP11642.1 hypothetical protein CCACVL1_00369 [Corchorus capsularis]
MARLRLSMASAGDAKAASVVGMVLEWCL